jgi:hypothetical protein
MAEQIKINEDIGPNGGGLATISKCPRCNKSSVGIRLLKRHSQNATCICLDCNKVFLLEGLTNHRLPNSAVRNVATIPRPKSDYAHEVSKLPENLQEDFRQAVSSFENMNFDASTTMSRRTLQHIARSTLQEKGIASPSNTLQKELETLRDNSLIFPKTFEMYETIKNIGNFGAHPDELDLEKHTTEQEAENALRVVLLFIKEIYEIDTLYDAIKTTEKTTDE